ncbi:pilin, partial [Patescibacteria group bacterium]|nr:pilin [Patescibacteria group bacterium]
YQCSTGHAGIPIPSGTAYLEYEGNTSKPNGQAGTWIWYVDAIVQPKPIPACGSNSNTQSCLSCLSNNKNHVYTDFGCVNATPSGVIDFLYAFLLVIAFMIDLVIFIISGYLIMSSGGDPDKINRGKTLFKNAIIGLLVIIFAMVILNLIGHIFGISGL